MISIDGEILNVRNNKYIDETSNCCKICKDMPKSHSFSKIHENQHISVFYTCPSMATKYFDSDGIVNHYEALLKQNGSKEWVWIFDSYDYELKYTLEINTLYRIIDLLINKKYGDNLKKILIINPVWHVHTLLNIIWPFLNDHLKSIIITVNDNNIINI